MTWIVTLFALTGVILNIKKDKKCFIVWSFTNLFWCVHNFRISEYALSALFAVYFILAIVGLWQWRKDENKKRGEKQIRTLAQAAIVQLNLPKNQAKGGWKNCGDGVLCERIYEELYEFFDAVYQYRAIPIPENQQHIREEAGDAVNFIMMLADNCGALEVTK